MENKSATPLATRKDRGKGEWAITALSFLAWIGLISGIIGALWIWSVGTDNPFMTTWGVAILLQGVFGYVFFLAIVSMAENLVAIRNAIETKKN